MMLLDNGTPHSTEWTREEKGEEDENAEGETDLLQADNADSGVDVPADVDRDVEVDTDGDMSRLPSYRTIDALQHSTNDK